MFVAINHDHIVFKVPSTYQKKKKKIHQRIKCFKRGLEKILNYSKSLINFNISSFHFNKHVLKHSKQNGKIFLKIYSLVAKKQSAVISQHRYRLGSFQQQQKYKSQKFFQKYMIPLENFIVNIPSCKIFMSKLMIEAQFSDKVHNMVLIY